MQKRNLTGYPPLYPPFPLSVQIFNPSEVKPLRTKTKITVLITDWYFYNISYILRSHLYPRWLRGRLKRLLYTAYTSMTEPSSVVWVIKCVLTWTISSISARLMYPFPSRSYMLKAQRSFCSSPPRDVTLRAMMNSLKSMVASPLVSNVRKTCSANFEASP